MATRFVGAPCDVTGLLRKFKCPGGGGGVGGVNKGVARGVDVEVTNSIPANSHMFCLWTKSQIRTNCFFTHDT